MTQQTKTLESLDLSSLAPEVGTWVAVINERVQARTLKLTSAGVPDIPALEAAVELPDGEKVKLTAKLRDEAWNAYRELTKAIPAPDQKIDEVGDEYLVLEPIKHDGDLYPPASFIYLSESAAKSLLGCGAIRHEPQETQS
ncbi:hypothetical protein [Gynuella sp.]|uniref:hypothetical protein n=1 Tax=Gynuella sp. TaxID=2969146 RepID=UPI003D0F4F27